MQLVGVYLRPVAEILLVYRAGEMKMSISHKQIVHKTFILVQQRREIATNIYAAD
jgi:hypothetical protein